MYSIRMVMSTLVITLIILTKSTLAQVGTTALPFLEINNNARSVGLAGADVAMMGGNGAFLNPATLGNRNSITISSPFTRESGYSFFSTPWLPSLNDNLSYQNPSIIVGLDRLTIAYHFNKFDAGEVDTRLRVSEGEGDIYRNYDQIHGFSMSYSVGEKFSIGTGINSYKSNIYNGSFTGLSFDFGAYFQNPITFHDLKITPSVGWSLTDFGSNIETDRQDFFVDVDGEGSVHTLLQPDYPLSTLMRGGIGLKFEATKNVLGYTPLSIGFYGALSKKMVRFKDDRYPYSPFETLYKSWDTYSYFNGSETIELPLWDQLIRHSGIEINVLEIVSIRSGHFYQHENNGGLNYDTFGIGVHYKFFALDYAELVFPYRSSPLAGTKYYQLSINIPLDDVTGLFKK